MPITVIVEPDPRGHRFQAVANVAAVAGRASDVVLLTSAGAADEPSFGVYLADAPVEVLPVFDAIQPTTAALLDAVVAIARERSVERVVVMDADQSLKRWWLDAPRAFRGLGPRKPEVVFMLTRYPARLRLDDLTGWRLRVPKATLAVAAMATGSLHRVAGFAGREDMSRGWIVKRTRDPDICSAHSRDRARLRAELGLPADRGLVGIFGVIGERKNAPMIWEAMQRRRIDADLVLAGGVQPEVEAWLESVPPSPLGRIIVNKGFLDNDLLDKYVAAADVVPLALTNNGPSGIMGKALAAGVPVVTAGSTVRAREIAATDGGEAADFDVDSIGAAIDRMLQRPVDRPRRSDVPPASPEEFARNLLGVDEAGRPTGRRTRRRR